MRISLVASFCFLFSWAALLAGQEERSLSILANENDYVRVGLDRSPIIERMSKLVDLAQSRVRMAGGGLRPQVDGTAVYGVGGSGLGVETGALGYHYDLDADVQEETVRTQLSLKQTLSKDTEVGDQIRLAEVELQIAAAEYERQRQQIAYRIKESLYNYLKAREFVEIQRRSVKLGEENLERTLKRRRLNTATQIDVLQAEGELAMRREGLIASENAVKLAEDVINNLMGFPLGVSHDPDPVERSLPEVMAEEACVRKGQRNRPELLAAQGAIHRSTLLRRAAKRRYRPLLFLVGTYTWDDLDVRSTLTTSGLSPGYLILDVTPELYGHETYSFEHELSGALVNTNLSVDSITEENGTLERTFQWINGHIFDHKLLSKEAQPYFDWEQGDEWLFAAGVRLPLYDGGIKREQVHQTIIEEQRAQKDLQILMDTIVLETKKAYFSYNQARERIRVLENTVAQADEVLRFVRKRGDLGLAASYEESEAELAVKNALMAQTNAFFDALLAKADLDRSIGTVY